MNNIGDVHRYYNRCFIITKIYYDKNGEAYSFVILELYKFVFSEIGKIWLMTQTKCIIEYE